MELRLSPGGLSLMALLLAGLALVAPTRAAELYWVGGSAAFWDNGLNWSLTDGGPGGAGQPQAGDDVSLTRALEGGDLTVTYRNSLNSGVQLGTLEIYGFGQGLLTVEQSGSDQLKTTREYIGTVGRGAYSQSNGANLVAGEVRLGCGSGSFGSYNLSGGNLTEATLTLGFSGSGSFIQSGGSNAVANLAVLGNYAGSSGSYDLKDGSFSSNWQVIGNGGSGNFTQSGGSLTANNAILGLYGRGSATQTGGSSSISNSLCLGYYAGGSGAYDLAAGSVRTLNLTVGSKGTGSFTQRGGSLTVTNALDIGRDPAGRGTYSLNGGTLTTQGLTVGSSGTGAVTGSMSVNDAAAQVMVGGDFTINAGGQFSAAPGVTVTLTGSKVRILSDHVDMSQMTLYFANPNDLNTLEVGVADFHLGDLALIAGASLQLLGNGLYVDTLELGNGCVLDLNGFNLYYLTEILEPDARVTFLNGTPQPAPLPGTCWLLACGLLVLAGWRRLRSASYSDCQK